MIYIIFVPYSLGGIGHQEKKYFPQTIVKRIVLSFSSLTGSAMNVFILNLNATTNLEEWHSIRKNVFYMVENHFNVIFIYI